MTKKYTIFKTLTYIISISTLFIFSPCHSAEVKKKKDIPFFSVLLPTYNRANLLPNAIDSILNQTYQDFELIVLDDASTDSTHELLNTYQQKNDKIRVITLPKNQGVAHARNILNQNAKGKYIALMDSDDKAHSTWLEQMHKFIMQHPNIEIILAKRTNQKNILWDKKLKNILLENSFSNVGNVFLKQFVEKHNISYNADYFCGEDYDFWVQMLLKGAKVRYLNSKEPLVLFREHKQNSHNYYQECKIIRFTIREKIAQHLDINIKGKNFDIMCDVHDAFLKKYPDTFDKAEKEKDFQPCILKKLNKQIRS